MSESLKIGHYIEFFKKTDELLIVLIPLQSIVKIPFPTEYLFYHIGERLRQTIQTLTFFLQNEPGKHVHGMGLLLRNVYSDFILSAYLYCFNNKKELIEEKVFIYLYYEILKEKSYITHLRNKKILTDVQFNEYEKRTSGEKNLKHLTITYYKELIKKNNVKKINFPSIAQILNVIDETKNGKTVKNFVYKAYDTWKLLSQFEHVGINSYLMTRDAQKYIDLTCKSVEFIMLQSNIIFDIMKENELQKKAHNLILDYRKFNDK